MDNLRQSLLVPVLTLFVLLILAGCDPDADNVNVTPPEDSDPQVTLISPSTGYALASIGETVEITFEIHDNELLTNWWATERWESVSGVEVLAESPIPGQEAVIATNNEERVISYTIPPSVQVYTTIEIRGYAQDNKGKQAVAMFRINVIPQSDDTVIYELESYSDDTLYSITTGDDYNYDLILRQRGNDLEIPGPNRYIRESSMPPAIDYILTSPISGTGDSVLVTTNTGLFNFEDCTYETIYQAFATSNRIGDKTDPLSPGDVVILKLPNNPHFAAIHIKTTANGRMTFDHKRSYE